MKNFRIVLNLLFILTACSTQGPEVKTRPKTTSFAEKTYGIVCTRLGSTLLAEDLDGLSYKNLCFQNSTGQFDSQIDRGALPKPPTEELLQLQSESIKKLELFAQERPHFVASVNALAPEDMPAALDNYVKRITRFFKDETKNVPVFTQKLGKLLGQLAQNEFAIKEITNSQAMDSAFSLFSEYSKKKDVLSQLFESHSTNEPTIVSLLNALSHQFSKPQVDLNWNEFLLDNKDSEGNSLLDHLLTEFSKIPNETLNASLLPLFIETVESLKKNGSSPVTNILYEITSVLQEDAGRDFLALVSHLAKTNPKLFHKLIQDWEIVSQIGREFPEEISQNSAIHDDLLEYLSRLSAVNSRQANNQLLLEDLIDGISGVLRTMNGGVVSATMTDEVRALPKALSKLMLYKDRITYNHRNLSSYSPHSPGNATINADLPNEFPGVLVNRSLADVDENQSHFQKVLKVFMDLNGVTICNKPGAYIHADYLNIRLPLGPFPECDIFRVENIAEFYLQSITGNAHLELNSSLLRSALGLGGIFLDEGNLIESSVGIKDFTLSPTPHALHRFIAFGAETPRFLGSDGQDLDKNLTTSNKKANRFIKDFVYPISTMSCLKDNKGVNQCENFAQTFRARNPNSLFSLEHHGFFPALKYILQPFVNHNREDLLLSLFDIFNRHWPKNASNLSSLEPMFAKILNSDLPDSLVDYFRWARAISGQELQLSNPYNKNGKTITANFIRALVRKQNGTSHADNMRKSFAKLKAANLNIELSFLSNSFVVEKTLSSLSTKIEKDCHHKARCNWTQENLIPAVNAFISQPLLGEGLKFYQQSKTRQSSSADDLINYLKQNPEKLSRIVSELLSRNHSSQFWSLFFSESPSANHDFLDSLKSAVADVTGSHIDHEQVVPKVIENLLSKKDELNGKSPLETLVRIFTLVEGNDLSSREVNTAKLLSAFSRFLLDDKRGMEQLYTILRGHSLK